MNRTAVCWDEGRESQFGGRDSTCESSAIWMSFGKVEREFVEWRTGDLTRELEAEVWIESFGLIPRASYTAESRASEDSLVRDTLFDDWIEIKVELNAVRQHSAGLEEERKFTKHFLWIIVRQVEHDNFWYAARFLHCLHDVISCNNSW